MSVLSKYIQRQIKKKGLTGIVMYVVKQYVKMTPSKKDDEFVERWKLFFVSMKINKWSGENNAQ